MYYHQIWCKISYTIINAQTKNCPYFTFCCLRVLFRIVKVITSNVVINYTRNVYTLNKLL